MKHEALLVEFSDERPLASSPDERQSLTLIFTLYFYVISVY